jgi:hypothetical protein
MPDFVHIQLVLSGLRHADRHDVSIIVNVLNFMKMGVKANTSIYPITILPGEPQNYCI